MTSEEFIADASLAEKLIPCGTIVIEIINLDKLST